MVNISCDLTIDIIFIMAMLLLTKNLYGEIKIRFLPEGVLFPMSSVHGNGLYKHFLHVHLKSTLDLH